VHPRNFPFLDSPSPHRQNTPPNGCEAPPPKAPSMTAGPSDQGSESGWATLIGIIICLSGNVVISFALNIQRLAHERIQRRRQAARRTPTESSATTYGTVHPPKTGDEEDGEEEENEVLYLRSKLWWTGLVLMAVGETGNFVACTAPSPQGSSGEFCEPGIAILCVLWRLMLMSG